MKVFDKIFSQNTANATPFTTAIIVAAGSSTRMKLGNNVTKQLMEIDGIPVIAYTLQAFQKSESIDEIIVVSRAEQMVEMQSIVKKYKIKKVKSIVVGGSTRQKSVMSGFLSIDQRTEYVAIHDASRCLITPEIINKVTSTAYQYGSASAACRIVDTIKLVTKDGVIDRTIPRDVLWAASTPQVFRADQYRIALFNAEKNELVATDDNYIMEASGFRIHIVETSSENFKITTMEDFVRAEELILRRKRRHK